MTNDIQDAVNALAVTGGNKAEAARSLGIARSTLQSRLDAAARQGVRPTSLPAELEVRFLEVQAAHVEEVRHLKALVAAATKDNITTDMVRQEIFKLGAHTPKPPKWRFKTDTPVDHSPGIPTLFLSDWHWGEVVDPRKVNGVNEYNPAIASRRWQNCISRAIRLMKKQAIDKYPYVVLILGGDMVSGDIHDELRETNALSNFEAILEVFEHSVAAIVEMEKHFGKVLVPCVYGNHGRLTTKPHHKNAAVTNCDWLVYTMLERHFKGNPNVEILAGQGFDCRYSVYNCLAVGHKVLTQDLRWVPVESLRVGDKLFGFDENLADGKGRGRTRRWKPATVLATGTDTREVVKITFESGKVLTCTPDHKLLCHTTYGSGSLWVQAKDIKPGWALPKYFDIWETSSSYEDGWLAGMWDGEGFLGYNSGRKGNVQPVVSQNAGIVLDRIQQAMDKRGFMYHTDFSKRCVRVTLQGGLGESLRFLGSVRPIRLLNSYIDKFTSAKHGPHMSAIAEDIVLSVEPNGRQTVVVMGTDTETYVAEGFANHNTSYLLTHGDRLGVNGGNGAAGVIAPITRGIQRLKANYSAINKPVDLVLMGHFHNPLNPEGGKVNDCGKGYDEYAMAMRFDPHPPLQRLWYTHPKYGITTETSVFLD